MYRNLGPEDDWFDLERRQELADAQDKRIAVAKGKGSECDRLASIVIARTYGDPIGAYRFTTRSEYGIETQQQIKWFRLWGRLSELVGNRPIKFIVLDDDEVFEVQFLD